ncbi:phosphotransferase [Nodosilinea sp. P-1105]|uniref:phosphotransferase n=1 Tax=Nodosilinea sp. P-1105 TaxID=2546229 RepID=UPI00146E37DC|nr:phosphotransferase [Nodosilinea sp. P-1105]NMF83032.1 hypothetical protein [Nodosilinea sp. P-1105]
MKMKAISINHFPFIRSSRRLARSLPFYKFFSEWRNREKIKFYELYNQGKFSEAISFGEIALRRKKNDYYLRRSLAKAYRNLGHHDLATLKIAEVLSKILGKDPDLIISETQKEVTKVLGKSNIESKLIYLGGMNNYGQVQHKIIDKNSQEKFYLTKITTPNKVKREHYFYKFLCKNNPELQLITANFIGYSESEDRKFAFLTLDKIRGNSIKLDHIQSVINANKLLSSLRFDFDLHTSNFSPAMDRSSITLDFRQNHIRPDFFSAIHQQEANTLIIKWLYERLFKHNKHKYMRTSKNLITKLEFIVLKNKFYKKIVPSKHYSLVHGDFGRQNILADEQNGRIYVIDWSGYFLGPAKFDMTRFFESFPLNFHEIKQKYIDNIIHEDCNNSVIEVSLFIYLLIASWFKEKNIDRVLKNHDNYLVPAIEHLEYLTRKIL